MSFHLRQREIEGGTGRHGKGAVIDHAPWRPAAQQTQVLVSTLTHSQESWVGTIFIEQQKSCMSKLVQIKLVLLKG